MEDRTPVLLTINQATAVLHQSRSTLYRKIKEGHLRAFRLGASGPLRITPDALAEHLRESVPTTSGRPSAALPASPAPAGMPAGDTADPPTVGDGGPRPAAGHQQKGLNDA